MKIEKIVVVGGGSYLWTPRMVGYMACAASLRDAEVVLVDISLAKAQEIADVMNRVVARAYPQTRLRCRGEVKLEAALPGAQIVFTCFQNLGKKTETRATEIGKAYGAAENAFSAGPGMVVYLAAQGPAMINVVRQMQTHCPDAVIINGSNPMPALCMIAHYAGWPARQIIGGDGSITANRLTAARFLKVPVEDVTFRTTGTNHLTFLTDLKVRGTDATPLLRQRAKEQPWVDLWCWGRSETEVKILNAIGYFASGGHPSDLLPTLAGKMLPPDPASIAESFLDNRVEYTPEFVGILHAYARGEKVEWQPPDKIDATIMWLESLSGAEPGRVFSAHFLNLGTIANLPDWTFLEMEALFDTRGVTPLAQPPYPEIIAEIVRRHQVVFDMAARGVVQHDRRLLREAIQLCPFGNYWETAEAILNDARAAFGPGDHSMKPGDYSQCQDSYYRNGVPRGTITKHMWSNSSVYPGSTRDWWLYVPAQYRPDRPAAVMVVQDGGSHVDTDQDFRIPIVFDSLNHPTLVAFEGQCAVVYDTGNQRIVKLKIR